MSDLIDREAVENWLRTECYGTDTDDDKEYVIGRLREELPTIAATRWHRVEEPPKEEGKYLVSDGRGNYFVVWWGPRLGWCYDPKFFCYWMPIEPPKEEN